MPIIGSYNGIQIYDSNDPSANMIGPTLINSYSALTIPAYWRAINFLASNLGSFPRAVHSNGSKLDVPHPLDKLLKRKPNNYQNATKFWRTLFAHAAHCGNGYGEIKRTPTGKVDSLHNLMPEEVAPFRYDAGTGRGIEQYYFHFPTKRVLASADVVHLSALGYDGQTGLDPVYLFSQTLQRARALDKYLTRYLQKGTVLRGSIEIPQGASPEQIDSVISTLRTYFSGADAERDVIVLSDGAKLNNATLSPQESQLVEQGAYTTKEIAQITGVPPQFLYEFSESKYNNSIEQMGQDVVRYTFRPWIEQTEDELTIKLLTEEEQQAGYTVRLDPDALLRGDAQTQTTTLTAQVVAGIRTRNEARAVLDLPADPSPTSDALTQLGDTTPQAARAPAAAPPAKHSAQNAGDRDAYAALTPILTAAVERVEAKTSKAFEARAAKPEAERTVWSNVFAEEQARYVAESLAPVAAALASLTGDDLDTAAVAQRYAAQIRRRAVTNEPTDLAAIVEAIRGNHAA